MNDITENGVKECRIKYDLLGITVGYAVLVLVFIMCLSVSYKAKSPLNIELVNE
jgi:hypothetical protein